MVGLKFCELSLSEHITTAGVHYFVAVTCTTLGLLANGDIQYSNGRVPSKGYPIHTIATILCDHGYSLTGPSTKTCQISGSWNHGTPTCNQSKVHIKKYLHISHSYSLSKYFIIKAILFEVDKVM